MNGWQLTIHWATDVRESRYRPASASRRALRISQALKAIQDAGDAAALLRNRRDHAPLPVEIETVANGANVFRDARSAPRPG
jgi:hypothetical protein